MFFIIFLIISGCFTIMSCNDIFGFIVISAIIFCRLISSCFLAARAWDISSTFVRVRSLSYWDFNIEISVSIYAIFFYISIISFSSTFIFFRKLNILLGCYYIIIIFLLYLYYVVINNYFFFKKKVI